MDTDAVIARKPQVALVDELAHTNAPGSKHEKRWQDVHDILDAGITVISTVNIQHLESLADIVETITGRARCASASPMRWSTTPTRSKWSTCRRTRCGRGSGTATSIRRSGRSRRCDSFFREGNLNALRELALRKVATVVEEDLEEYMRGHDIDEAWPAAEGVLVGVDDSPNAQRVIRRAWRLANRLGSPLTAVFVETAGMGRDGPEERMALEANLRLAEDLGADIVRN